MSTLTWLAHSESERRRTLEVIQLLDEPGTLDEIGIGGIRDAFAELLFPGTSTIQTRARYFLFVPWIYRSLEDRAPQADSAKRVRKAEMKLIEELLAAGETSGVIGRFARSRLRRLPSEIYWQGLETWGLRVGQISLRAYHRRLERHRFGRSEEGETAGSVSVWHGHLPRAPNDFPTNVDLELTEEEADYLRDRVMTKRAGTLLAQLLAEPRERPEAGFVWELDLDQISAVSDEVREQLRHAKAFSNVIHGAQLLYNLMLAEASRRTPESDHYGEQLDLWAIQIEAEDVVLADWAAERALFWEIVRRGNPWLRPRAQRFAQEWFDLALSGDPAKLRKSDRARSAVADRERELKGRLARLQNPSALESWKGSSGASQLDFRWAQTQTLIADIIAPLDPSGATV